MKVYILIAALLLPHLVHSQTYINRVFRRARASHRYTAASPRQVRFSRYIQEQKHEQEVQQKHTDDADVEQDFEPLIDNFSQSPISEKTTKMFNGYTKSPSLFQTSTPQPVQFKEQDVDEQSQQKQQSNGESFEDIDDTQQKYEQNGNRKNGNVPYSPANQYKSNGQDTGTTTGESLPGTFGPTEDSLPRGFGSIGGDTGSFESNSDHSGDFESEHDHNTIDWLRGSVRGEPGQDYPIFSSIPETSFKCSEQSLPGYYADVDAQCQVFHVCQDGGRSDAFLCPNGTIFSQQHFACVWWFDFDCSQAPQYYNLNSALYQETEAKQIGPQANSLPTGFGEYEGVTEPSTSGRLSSPKENLNKMYKSQIDDFRGNGVTTSMPNYYSNGKTTMRASNGYKTTPSSVQYDVSSPVDSVTPSSVGSYETTPFNIDEALGEEIHSETPLIESLPLTTHLPFLGEITAFEDGQTNGHKPTNGKMMMDYYNNKYGSKQPAQSTNGFNGYNTPYSNKKSSSNGSAKSNYGGVKSGSTKSNGNGKQQPQQQRIGQYPESPVKNGRTNGGSITYAAGGGMKLKNGNGNSYGNGNRNGYSNGNGYANGNGNGHKSQKSYSGVKH